MVDVQARHRAPGVAGARKSRRRRWLVTGAAIAVLALAATGIGLSHALTPSRQPQTSPPTTTPRQHTTHHTTVHQASGQPYRAFLANSWWNTQVPDNAPLDPNGTKILNYLRTAPENGGGCLKLAGAEHSKWGQPIYWAKPSDPSYNVGGVANGRPPELDHLRIPAGARAASNSDGTMSIFDLSAGYVTALTDAKYDSRTDTWTASGASVTYLDSNGLHVLTGESDNPDNTGTHRGNNGATMAVRWDMVEAGRINHVLKVASGPELANRWVFPMVGSDGGYQGNNPAIPPEGLRLRVKPSVNLHKLDLPPQALVIARALQRYGMYLGDSGNTTAVKLEDTEQEGRGDLWNLSANDLCGLPFTPAYWDVLSEGYDPSTEGYAKSTAR
jgi:hypothetical protein